MKYEYHLSLHRTSYGRLWRAAERLQKHRRGTIAVVDAVVLHACAAFAADVVASSSSAVVKTEAGKLAYDVGPLVDSLARQEQGRTCDCYWHT